MFFNLGFRHSNCCIKLVLLVLVAIVWAQSYALTSGPSQPEFQSFKPVNSSNLVDPFTGDLSYSIPLIQVGDYPITLTYQSGVAMDQEASWVGLGWNINTGAIVRNVRGLPDDFSGDEIIRELSLKPNETFGGSLGVGLEIFGDSSLSGALGLSVGIKDNTYNDASVDFSISPSLSSGHGSQTTLTANLGVSADNGVSFSPSLSYSAFMMNKGKSIQEGRYGVSAGLTANSRHGMQQLNLNPTVSQNSLYSRTSSISHTFLDRGYTPNIQMPLLNESLSLGGRVGGELFGFTGNINGLFYHSGQFLETNRYSLPGYGYLYAHRANDARALHDVDRDDRGEVLVTQPHLPMGYQTHDTFHVTAHGIGGTFRAKRSDIGMLHEPFQVLGTKRSGDSVMLEIAGGNAIKVGADVAINNVTSTVSPWKDDNRLTDTLVFEGYDENSPDYEPVYFKNIGELTEESDMNLFMSLGDTNAVQVKLSDGIEYSKGTAEGCLQIYLEEECVNVEGGFPGRSKSEKRKPRKTHFSYLTAEEASMYGLDKNIKIYKRWYENELVSDTSPDGFIEHYTSHERYGDDENIKKAHHISEITVTRDDGTRFVYGLPVYNLIKEEVSFSVGVQDSSSCGNDSSLTAYSPDEASVCVGDLCTASDRNNYYSKTTTPPYAYTYLLTAILSPDFNDLTLNGPTSDDNGTYVKFNYQAGANNYKWRAPYTTQENCALFQEGLKSADLDNTASYVYGEKEVRYLHSIETRNYVAEFHLQDRTDGHEAGARKGGVGTSQLQALKEIRLYNKAERWNTERDEAIPIKTAHFGYDYSLAPNTDNALSGKLTLKSLRYSYRNSSKGLFSPYKFEYKGGVEYDNNAVDRWGSYKPISSGLSNSRFPYVDQTDKTAVNEYIDSFHLTDIYLPSGSTLSVEYEAKDYAYIQDRKAQYMNLISATGSSPTEKCRTETTFYLEEDDGTICPYLFFKLLEPTSDENVLREYVESMIHIYINAEVFVTSNDLEKKELVQAFMDLSRTDDEQIEIGFDESTLVGERYEGAWIKVTPYSLPEGVNTTTGEVEFRFRHPLTQSTVDLIKRNLTHIVKDGEESGDDVGEAIVNTLSSISEIYEDIDTKIIDRGNGKKLVPENTFIRLNHPSKKKLGGGVRVKAITLNDKWGQMTQRDPAFVNLLDFDYRKEYSYVTSENINGVEREISSGVAMYEPAVGGDENPLVQPIPYVFNGQKFYQTTPIGEAFYPAPDYRALKGYRYKCIPRACSDKRERKNWLSGK